MNTCARCQFYRSHYGEQKGFCYGLPPAAFPGGYQQVNPVEVKQSRPACSLFAALPEGTETLVQGKVCLETPGDAIKQKRELEAANKPPGKPPVKSGKK